MKNYRIGEFAKKVGVTPDFLKYYEKHGLIKPEIDSDGYRYYTATNVSPIIECIKLKNWGFSAKETARLIHDTGFKQTVELLKERENDIENHANFLNELLVNIRIMSSSLPFYESENPWNIKTTRGFYFLSQSKDFVFEPDNGRFEIIKSWLRWVPIICSTARVDSTIKKPSVEWGYSVSEDFVEKQKVSIEPPVEYIPPHRYLEYFDKRLLEEDQDNDDLEGVRRGMFIHVKKVIEKYNLTVTGPSYFMVQTKLYENEKRYTYQKVYVPIK